MSKEEVEMNKNNNDNTDVDQDKGYTVKMEKIIEEDYPVKEEDAIPEDYTIRMEKIREEDHTDKIEKETKWTKFKELVGKGITTCAKRFGKYIALCGKKIGEYTIVCAKEVGKYTVICAKKVSEVTTVCAKKISETKFSGIMNAKYNEVYGKAREALIKIACRLNLTKETKEVRVVEQPKESVTTLEAKPVTIKKASTLFISILKKTFALIKCIAVFILNAAIILCILVARVIYYTVKEIIYAIKEIVTRLKDDVTKWYQSKV